jgi:hypothetical protein
MLRGHMALQVLKCPVAAWADAFGDPVLDSGLSGFLSASLAFLRIPVGARSVEHVLCCGELAAQFFKVRFLRPVPMAPADGAVERLVIAPPLSNQVVAHVDDVTASRFDSGYVGVGGYNHFGHSLNFGEGIKHNCSRDRLSGYLRVDLGQ